MLVPRGVLFLLLCALVTAANHCVWYGQCHEDAAGYQNCLNHTEPLPLTDTGAIAVFERLCPSINHTALCCDATMVYTMGNSSSPLLSIFGSCPTCTYNLMQIFCEMTCSPIQETFLVPTVVNFTNPQNETISYVSSTRYDVNEKTISDIYTSCATTKSSGMTAMSNFGGTLDSFLASFGGLSPFPISYNRTVVGGMTTAVPPCTAAAPGTSEPCSCQDCPQKTSCPKPVPHPAEAPCLVFNNIDCYLFVASAVTVALIVFTASFAAIAYSRTKDVTQELVSLSLSKNESASPSTSSLARFNTHVEMALQRSSFKYAQLVTSKWGLIISPVCGLVIAIICACGLARWLPPTTDPVQLWSSPTSQTRLNLNYFNEHFEPFYRTEQLFLYPVKDAMWDSMDCLGNPITVGPIFQKEFILAVHALQTEIVNLKADFVDHKNSSYHASVSLSDICVKPLYPDYKPCGIMSLTQYLGNDPANFVDNTTSYCFGDVYVNQLIACTRAPLTVNMTAQGHPELLNASCLGDWGGPVFPWVALGDFPNVTSESPLYIEAKVAVVTFPVHNFANDDFLDKAKAWEKVYLDFIRDVAMTKYKDQFRIVYSAERSIEDEIARESTTDLSTIIISYTVMFFYVALALGEVTSFPLIFIRAKFTLGFVGVCLVALSVMASIGFFELANIAPTMIIFEVVPFIILAVGVDNIFILVQAVQRSPNKTPDALPEIFSQVGPSLLLTSLSESVAFWSGAMSSMPAVRQFALYAGLAVLFNFMLQLTVFLPLIHLDMRRMAAKRFDVACCFSSNEAPTNEKSKSLILSAFSHGLSPVVMKPISRVVIFVFFVSATLFAIAAMPHIELGLDQEVSMPTDSYLIDYLHAIAHTLEVGAPVYFVVKSGYNYTDIGRQNDICGGFGCRNTSLMSQLSFAAASPNWTRINTAPMSWIDDYYSWANPTSIKCCRLDSEGNFCSSTEKNCTMNMCLNSTTFQNNRIQPNMFTHYLDDYIQDNPNADCPKGGHAAYSAALERSGKPGAIPGATYFMSYHTICRTSADYTEALRQAQSLADNVTAALDGHGEVFPYSVFYVYYEQYLTIVYETVRGLCVVLACIFVITTLLTDIHTSLLILFTICMIVVDMFGVMYLLKIPLNAVSLVNLVMSCGIAVEFCSHVARKFALARRGTRVERAQLALTQTGSSVFSGITLTKLGGIVVLAFAKSQLFFIFYFQMLLSMVVLGALHGLLFLPVLLSVVGPPPRPEPVNPYCDLDKEEDAPSVPADDEIEYRITQ